MAGTPNTPGGDRDRRRDGAVQEKEREKVAKPPKYKVVLYNDDYTPMEFVVALLEQIFKKPPVEANAVMLKIHKSGKGVAGIYTLDVAETKVANVHQLAEKNGYPLRAGVEEE